MRKYLVISILLIFMSFHLNAQLAQGKCKFLGNIIASSVPSNFKNYWNQVTPENAGKWGSVESALNVMNWTGLDLAYNYARKNEFPFREHTLIWGQQQPAWIGSLPADMQRAEVEEWIRLFSERYPEADFIDVVNEPLHAVPSYSEALGGSGETGYDWVVWAFRKARYYCPHARLQLNEYGILGSSSATGQYLALINILRGKDLIDCIGLQGHGLEKVSASTIKANLNKLATAGLPIYITEYDVNIADDTQQFRIYSQQFPVMWEHPWVAGITLWGYVQGQIWQQNAWLVQSDGTERQAMEWLKSYITTAEVKCWNTSDEGNNPDRGQDIEIFPNPAKNGLITVTLKDLMTEMMIFDITGRLVTKIPVYQQRIINVELDLSPGLYLLQFQGIRKQVTQKLYVF